MHLDTPPVDNPPSPQSRAHLQRGCPSIHPAARRSTTSFRPRKAGGHRHILGSIEHGSAASTPCLKGNQGRSPTCARPLPSQTLPSEIRNARHPEETGANGAKTAPPPLAWM